MFNNFDCEYSSLFRKNTSNSISESFKSKIDSGEIDKKIKIMVLEYCSRGTMEDLTDENKSLLHIKVAIFQILLGISTLQYHIPGFRHNDIHNNNIISKSILFTKYLSHLLLHHLPRYYGTTTIIY